MLGFSTPHYFSTVFKKTINMTPSEYANSIKAIIDDDIVWQTGEKDMETYIIKRKQNKDSFKSHTFYDEHSALWHLFTIWELFCLLGLLNPLSNVYIFCAMQQIFNFFVQIMKKTFKFISIGAIIPKVMILYIVFG